MDTSYLIVILDFIAAFLLGGAIIKLLLRIAYHNRLFDEPDGRKVHSIPVPRLGGMSFLPSIVIVIAFTAGSARNFTSTPLVSPSSRACACARARAVLRSAREVATFFNLRFPTSSISTPFRTKGIPK